MPAIADSRGNSKRIRVLGVDPGGTSGLCLHTDTGLEWWQLGPEEHHLKLWSMLNWTQPDVVVCERFDYRRRMDNVDLIPVEYIGLIKLWCLQHDVKYVEQTQLKGHKGLWTDKKLKEMKLYKPAMPHAMDATRQVLYYETTVLNEQYWINLYGEATR